MYTVNIGNHKKAYYPGPCNKGSRGNKRSVDILKRYNLVYNEKDKMYHVDNGLIEVFASKSETECENWIMCANELEDYKLDLGIELRKIRENCRVSGLKYSYIDNDLTRYAGDKFLSPKEDLESPEYQQYLDDKLRLSEYEQDIFKMGHESRKVFNFDYLKDSKPIKRDGPPTLADVYRNS